MIGGAGRACSSSTIHALSLLSWLFGNGARVALCKGREGGVVLLLAHFTTFVVVGDLRTRPTGAFPAVRNVAAATVLVFVVVIYPQPTLLFIFSFL